MTAGRGSRPRIALPWWAAVLLVALGARALSAVLLVLVAQGQEATPWGPAQPSYGVYTALFWDASWYRQIVEQGYPTALPLGPDGRVTQNALAFFPLYPALVKGVLAATGGTWVVVAPLVSVVASTVALLVVHQVVAHAVRSARPMVRRRAPLLTVALLATSAAAPVLQVAYTEAVALLGIAVGLWALQRERYAVAAVAVAALGLTRAVAAAFVLVVGVHAVTRWRAASRGGRPFPVRDRLAVAAVAVVAVVAAVAWPALVGWRTGVPDAYRLTQGAWRGRGEVVWLVPWLDVGRWLLGWWAIPVLAVLAGALAAGLASRRLRSLGPELHAWTVGYALYLVVVVEPGTSLIRFALLAFPAFAAVAVAAAGARRAWSVVLVAAGLAAQVAWVVWLWRLVPPAGWPP